MLRFPHCLDKRLTDGGKIVSPTRPLVSTPQKHYSSASDLVTYSFFVIPLYLQSVLVHSANRVTNRFNASCGFWE
jgi:hypothetical protein